MPADTMKLFAWAEVNGYEWPNWEQSENDVLAFGLHFYLRKIASIARRLTDPGCDNRSFWESELAEAKRKAVAYDYR